MRFCLGLQPQEGLISIAGGAFLLAEAPIERGDPCQGEVCPPPQWISLCQSDAPFVMAGSCSRSHRGGSSMARNPGAPRLLLCPCWRGWGFLGSPSKGRHCSGCLLRGGEDLVCWVEGNPCFPSEAPTSIPVVLCLAVPRFLDQGHGCLQWSGGLDSKVGA